MSVRDPKVKAEKLGVPSPEDILSNLKEQAEPAEKQKWLSYKIEVITPIFGGGVKAGEPDTKMPIRTSAIRGQLRYWWRFLATNRREQPLSGKELFEEERDIWGGMAEGKEDYSSKVKLRIHIDPDVPVEIKPCAKHHSWTIKNNQGEYEKKYQVIYDEAIPEYAMFPGRGELPDEAKEKKGKPPSNMTFQVSFTLEFSIDKDEKGDDKISFKDEIEPALRWWASFGGIGARTRRGAGSIKATDINSKKILTVSQGEVKKHQCHRVSLADEFDSLSAWKCCITILQQFRQLSPVKAERNGKTKIVDWIGVGRRTKANDRFESNRGPSGSNWPEANAIRKTTGKSSDKHRPKSDAPILFPRAMFGLPLGFAFLSPTDKGIPPETELLPVKNASLYDRLGSPLILKPIATIDGRFKPTALLMPYSHIQELDLRLRYKKQDIERRETKTESRRKFKQGTWWDESKARLVDPIRENNCTDALTAFMNFFAKGGA